MGSALDDQNMFFVKRPLKIPSRCSYPVEFELQREFIIRFNLFLSGYISSGLDDCYNVGLFLNRMVENALCSFCNILADLCHSIIFIFGPGIDNLFTELYVYIFAIRLVAAVIPSFDVVVENRDRNII